MKICIAAICAGILATAATSVFAEAARHMTVAALHQERVALAGQSVRIQGKVVKVNNGIMERNFLHVQDGSGTTDKHDNDLTITSKQTAKIGDQVTITGKVAIDRDFGYGYAYPLLLEEASLTPKK